MTRAQHAMLCGAVALSMMAYLMARRAALATGVKPVPWFQPKASALL